MTWQDQSESAAGLDLLSAPLVPLRRGAAAAAPSRRVAGAKRGRDRDEGDEAEGVRIDDDGKLRVEEGAAEGARVAGFAGGTHEMEVDPEDEIIRPGVKRRRGLEREVVQASKAEEAEGAQKPQPGRNSLSRKREERKLAAANDTFGANLGDQYASKKGASGDVMRAGAPQPFAYLPLNPRLLGKRQQRKAAETMGKLVRPSKGVTKAAKKGVRVGKHGLQARRGKGKKKP